MPCVLFYSSVSGADLNSDAESSAAGEKNESECEAKINNPFVQVNATLHKWL